MSEINLALKQENLISQKMFLFLKLQNKMYVIRTCLFLFLGYMWGTMAKTGGTGQLWQTCKKPNGVIFFNISVDFCQLWHVYMLWENGISISLKQVDTVGVDQFHTFVLLVSIKGALDKSNIFLFISSSVKDCKSN